MELPDAIDMIQPAIIQVAGWNCQNSFNPFGYVALGTGFIVDAGGYVVTALPVIDAWQSRHCQQLVALFALSDAEEKRASFVAYEVHVSATDAAHNLALLTIASNPLDSMTPDGRPGDESTLPVVSIARLDPTRPRDGTAVAISGYPLSEPTLITTSGAIASSWGMAAQIDTLNESTILDVYIADGQANPGNCGGPVYRVADGVVIGVCIQVQTAEFGLADTSFLTSAGLTIVVPSRYVIDLLEHQNVTGSSSQHR